MIGCRTETRITVHNPPADPDADCIRFTPCAQQHVSEERAMAVTA
jgi:hypothetical protein